MTLISSAITRPVAALKWCQEVTRTHSHTLYRGSLLYPARQREAVWAVYAACRVGDDITDAQSKGGSARAHLDAWWTQIEGVYAGKPGDSNMEQALAWAVAHYAVPLSAFAELYAGFAMDLDGQHYATLDDLMLYCHRVAGVVGFMIAPIGGYRGGEATLRSALALGQAMQLTNILRDVGEDLQLGRLYLPTELLNRYGVEVGDLRAGRVTPSYRALLRELEQRAREGYAEGQRSLPMLEGRAKYGVAVASRLYAGILDDLAVHAYDNLNRRAYVSNRRKLWLTFRELHDRQPRPDLCPLYWAEQVYLRLRDNRSASS